MSKQILCLDFDGVINSYYSGWEGADVIPDPPVDGAIDFMLGALKHFDVVIFSSRSHQPGGLSAMRDWLQIHAGDTWYESPDGPGIESVRFVTEKPPALLTIDDRAICFSGKWPSIEEIRNFKPWNKKSVACLNKQDRFANKLASAMVGHSMAEVTDVLTYALGCMLSEANPAVKTASIEKACEEIVRTAMGR